ncbi:MAG: hypothetical protein Pars2KO_22210 [Parasphingorhabdus sp.]
MRIVTNFNIAVLMAVSLFLAGCAGSREIGLAPSVEVTGLQELPAPKIAPTYKIAQRDSLEISAGDNALLTGTFVVTSDGTVTYPLIGSVQAEGLSLQELSRSIEDRLRGDFVLDPKISVRPTEESVLTVSVGGEVDKPGSYAARQSSSMMRAINNAGGLSDNAKADDVVIIRTVEGQKYIGLYNLAAISRGNYKDPDVYADDIIMVGQSGTRRFLQDILPFLQLASSVAIVVERATNSN